MTDQAHPFELAQIGPKKLLGPNGMPISTEMFQNKKADPPKTGNAFGNWAGRDITYATLPGGGVVQFDLSKLTVADFRNMRDHYQINASLAILSFMQHQSEFHVECDDKKIAEFADIQLHNNWTMLNRAMSQANWAGYSPNALEWDNNLNDRSVDLTKIKDLVPEECRVNWKLEEGWAPPGRTPPKFKTFDGIKQYTVGGWPIPVSNSFWYPLLMENGNYYGRKLLRPAFQSWFFSILLHLFANRYYERFGEPTPIGRAPFENESAPDGTQVAASTWMLQILQQLRNRSVVVLPNDSTEDRNGRPQYDYDIEYLESQMRGADFERYMTRLDEEMSIGLFTPILLLRTAEVGSYNLGVQHQQTYSLMIDAMNSDRAFYMDRYILSPLVDYNYSPNAPRAKVVFHKLGNNNAELLRDVIVQLVKKGAIQLDLVELGRETGMTFKEVKETIAPPAPAPAPAPAPGTKSPAPAPKPTPKQSITVQTMREAMQLAQTWNTQAEIIERVTGQIDNAIRLNKFDGNLRVNIGFKNRFERALSADGVENSVAATNELYDRMDAWLKDVLPLGNSEFPTTESFMVLFTRVLANEVQRIA